MNVLKNYTLDVEEDYNWLRQIDTLTSATQLHDNLCYATLIAVKPIQTTIFLFLLSLIHI